ncbi:MAG: hypothetical protein H0T90_09525 [Gemmatimonadales bacterium]|nr:hypothetical protein [Gemmatimonadales bacterium]
MTPQRLRQVETGEAYLRALGVTGDLRVRHLDSHARLEVSADQMGLVRAEWHEVLPFFLNLGFLTVELDPQGYRRGGLLAMAPRIVA